MYIGYRPAGVRALVYVYVPANKLHSLLALSTSTI